MLPQMIRRPLRGVATMLLTPILFSIRTGHWRSALAARAADRDGRPIPWLTYPAVDFLRGLDLGAASVLEFGSGQSTLWFSARARSVVSLEWQREWYDYVRAQLGGNVRLILSDHTPERAAIGDGPFDVVLVDGLHRLRAAEIAADLVAPDGLVMLDNSEGDWGPAGTKPIIELFAARGFMRVDFHGYAPGVWKPHCTSIFFRPGCRFLTGQAAPVC